MLNIGQGKNISIEVQGASRERAEEVIGQFREIIGPDKSMSSTGGIDLTSDKALSVQNNGESIKFHIDPAQLEQLRNAPGFVPVIISIQPMADLRQFLTQ